MSLLLASAAGAGALAIAGARGTSTVGKPAAPAVTTVAVRYGSSGVYGNVADISDVIDQPGIFVSATTDVDLMGVPCRWLVMANGAAYKTYNMHYPSVPITNSAQK